MNQPRFSISREIGTTFPKACLGVLECRVEVARSGDELWQEIEALTASVRSHLTLGKLPEESEIKELRESYKILGKEPSRYRGSAEALIRRILQDKPIYRINNVVEINNLISIESQCAVGSYDLSKIDGPAVLRVGRPGENYKGIGKELVDLDGLPIFSDHNGPFGSPTSDSERAMITPSTNRIAMVMISFAGGHLLDYLNRASELLRKHANGSNTEILVVHS